MSIKVVYSNSRGFITDLQLLEAEDETTREQSDRNRSIKLPRYGVWEPNARKGCSQVTFTSDSLDACKARLRPIGTELLGKPLDREIESALDAVDKVLGAK